MSNPVSLFTIAALAVVAAWAWLGAAVPMPASPLGSGEKLYCVSYAPFRGEQTPLDLSTRIEPRQIEEDLARLAQISDCVRTYSVDFGLDRVPEIAQRYGLKVLLGLWVSGHADRTAQQVDTGIALAKRFPDTVRAVIVGNEALLRGEIAPAALAELLRKVKAQVPMPVTYADVWEFWLRHRALAADVDFITIHILPYWEDHPIGAASAANHIASIRSRVAAEFPGREIMIGEVGWPSTGRMREGALPSPANQARVLHDLLARAKREGFQVNVIEAFDQPWKRYQEGTVGGHWGLITDPPRRFKFAWGEPVSDHPHWRRQAAGGVLFAAAVFGAALLGRRRAGAAAQWQTGGWAVVAAMAAIGGVMAGWSVERALVESLGVGGGLRSLAHVAAALVAPPLAAAALAAEVGVPSFRRFLGRTEERAGDALTRALALLMIVLGVLAVQAALGLVFNPRYLDIPFAPLTAAAVPLALLAALVPAAGARQRAEMAIAAILAASALFVVWNESVANWQAIWFALALALVAFTLVRVRDAPD